MVKPELVPYHQAKQKGEFTHCGDQMMVLFESVTEVSGFDIKHFGSAWQKMFQSYPGYRDHATKETMANLNSGKIPEASGSSSLELAGASRIAPLALFYSEDLDGFIHAARAQTVMTHSQSEVEACAELFVRVFMAVLKGSSPVTAFEKVLDGMSDVFGIEQMVRAGLDSRSEDTRGAIAQFGQMCSLQAALPSTIHLIAKYENNLQEALIENIMAGGDSSARGLLTGFILGGYQGIETIPEQWLDDLVAYEKIILLLR